MKNSALVILKQVIKDRYMIILLSALIVLALIFCIIVGLTIHASELQIVNHYTAFGTTNFYRSKWYYLLNFIGFGVMLMTINVALAGKLYVDKGRGFALAFVWFSLATLVIAAVLSHYILQVALLS
jgi:hypothetical protein